VKAIADDSEVNLSMKGNKKRPSTKALFIVLLEYDYAETALFMLSSTDITSFTALADEASKCFFCIVQLEVR
jgi:hypothetical protein